MTVTGGIQGTALAVEAHASANSNEQSNGTQHDAVRDGTDMFWDLPESGDAIVENLSLLADAVFTEFELPGLDTFHEALEELHPSPIGHHQNGFSTPSANSPALHPQNVKQAQRLRTRNKLLYLLFTFDIWLTTFWIAKYPSTISHLYIVQCVLLFFIRYFDWKRKKWHYYMYDWCYFGNFLIVMGILVNSLAPGHIRILKACFSYAMGPLAWSIIPFGNSLVYHSVEKFTTLFLHLYPACTLWAIRWYPPELMAVFLRSNSDQVQLWESASFFDLVLVPLLPYLLWATLYFAKIFIISPERIRSRGYHTLYSWVTLRPGLFSKIISKAPQPLQPLTYMGLHLFNAAWSMALCCIWWRSFWASSFFLISMFLVAAWNGGHFYVANDVKRDKNV